MPKDLGDFLEFVRRHYWLLPFFLCLACFIYGLILHMSRKRSRRTRARGLTRSGPLRFYEDVAVIFFVAGALFLITLVPFYIGRLVFA